MATLYGVNRTLLRTGTVNTIDPELVGAPVRVAIGTYTFLTTEAAADIIQLCGIDLPKGARILNWIMDHGDLANNRTLSLGFGSTGDAAVLMSATDCGAAADQKSLQDDGVDASLGYEIDGEDDAGIPILTLAGGAAAAVAVTVAIFYAVKGV